MAISLRFVNNRVGLDVFVVFSKSLIMEYAFSTNLINLERKIGIANFIQIVFENMELYLYVCYFRNMHLFYKSIEKLIG